MNKKIEKIILDNDWEIEEYDDEYSLQRYSPEGQEINLSFDKEEDFIEQLESKIDCFDVSYETSLWLDEYGHGKNGAPYDMKDVYEDMKWELNQMKILYTELTK